MKEQKQEVLAQASTVVFTAGLSGRPPIRNFPALATEQDTVCRARSTAHIKTRFSGRDTFILPEDKKSYQTDMRSHLC
jgi:hypothetical protein